MNVKKCTVKNCRRTDIVALQRQIQVISLPPSSDPNQLSHTETIMFHYFCQAHFDINELRKKNVRLLPAAALTTGGPNSMVGTETNPTNSSKLEDLLNNLDGNNRKRKTNDSEGHVKQVKLLNNGKSYTLNEAATSKDNTKVSVSFDKFQKFDSEDCETDPATLTEDNDCIITEPLQTVIDLSDDDSDGPDESNKMIELILCDETESEFTETSKEYLVEISNECQDEDTPEPLHINFVAFNNHDRTTESIDLTEPENDRIVECEDDETNQSSNSASTSTAVVEETNRTVGCGDGRSIYVTDVQTVDDEETVDIEDFRSSVTREIRRRLSKRFPGVVHSIAWNDDTQQFEVSISKRTGFKVDNAFQQFLREVVNQAIQCNNRVSKAKTVRISKKKDDTRVNENVILNKEYAKKPQEIVKLSETNGSVHPSSSPNAPTAPNANQILRKCVSYLGVKEETFRQIENLLSDRLRHRWILILLLRKIKLHESFPILSDVLCAEDDDCVNIFTQFLPLLSHNLKGFLQWPTNGREPLAIVDVFEIEIEKPSSLVKQNVAFCSRRQRYLTKFIISVTSSGCITYVSPPFHAIRNKIFMSCLLTIPNCCSVVANPNLFESVTLKKSSRISSLYDCDRHTERKICQRVFDYLRRFSLFSGISDLKNEMLLQHALTVVACLYNLELKQ